VIEDTFFSSSDGIEMERRGRRKQASGRRQKVGFGPQIDEKGCFSGPSPARLYVAAAHFVLRMRFQTTDY
jgi:hypothetical protein